VNLCSLLCTAELNVLNVTSDPCTFSSIGWSTPVNSNDRLTMGYSSERLIGVVVVSSSNNNSRSSSSRCSSSDKQQQQQYQHQQQQLLQQWQQQQQQW
jgi:hypothetical protein